MRYEIFEIGQRTTWKMKKLEMVQKHFKYNFTPLLFNNNNAELMNNRKGNGISK